MSNKDTNPKDVMAAGKAFLSCVPTSLISYASMAFFEGMMKYGAFNWRHAGIKTSVYINALERHLTRYKNGEEFDPETKVPHLASIIACAGIIIDASLHGKCTDDRADESKASNLMLRLVEQVQTHLRELHKDKHPTHYTRDRDSLIPTPKPVSPELPDLPEYHHNQWREYKDAGYYPTELLNNLEAQICVIHRDGTSYLTSPNVVSWSNITHWRYYG